MDDKKIKELMEQLGFDFTDGTGREPGSHLPTDYVKFSALARLIAGAIIDWVKPQLEADEPSPEDEILEWAEEWLVG
jgi:hypothetical protein